MSSEDFNATLDTLKGFISRCKRYEITPDESHIEYYLTTCNSLEMTDIFIKYCFYYWHFENVEMGLLSVINNKIDTAIYRKIDVINRVQTRNYLTDKEIAENVGVCPETYSRIRRKINRYDRTGNIDKVYNYLLSVD